MNIETFTDQNWEKDVLGRPTAGARGLLGRVVRALQAMVPDLEAVAAQYDGPRCKVGKLNVEENDKVPFDYSIRRCRRCSCFKGGKVAEQRVGKMGRDQLAKLLDAHL